MSLYRESIQSLQTLVNLDRLRIISLISERALTTAEIADELGLGIDEVSAHLAILGREHLISTTKDQHERRMRLRVERLAEIDAWCGVQLASGLGEALPDESIPHSVRQFFRGKRLISIPAKHARHLEVLGVLVTDFALGTDYPETEVNEILNRRHGDYATIRRDLVDNGFMARTGGVYRRVR